MSGVNEAATRRPAIICDMDGTLVDVRKIRHLVDRPGHRDFDAFHAASIDCPVNEDVRDLLAARNDDGHVVVIVTAREARWSFLTSMWLRERRIDFDELMMRSSGDYRPDHVVKREFAKSLARRYDVRLAIDDRDDILEVWQSVGFATVKVASDGSLEQLHPGLEG